MILYFTGAVLTFANLLHAFIKDTTTPMTHFESWLVLIVATLLWPLIIPSLIRKQFRKSAQLVPVLNHYQR